jgi:hypothetical protein
MMKHRIIKVLGIVLTIALISSLFVFAAPVSAKSTEHFEVTIETSLHLPPNVTTISERWVGRPIVVDGVPLDGTVYISDMIAEWDIIGGTFGTGTMMGHFFSSYNYCSGKGRTLGICDLDFGGGDTLTVLMHCTKDFLGWEFPAPVKWSTEGRFTVISGTGSYENLRLVGDYAGAGGLGGIFTGIGCYAPAD